YLQGTTFMDIAVRQALGFPQQRRDIPVRFTLNHDKLRSWLANVALQQNHPPSPPRMVTPLPRWTNGNLTDTDLPPGYVGVSSHDWLWVEGKPGQTLDIDASIPLIVKTLTSGQDRVVTLASA